MHESKDIRPVHGGCDTTVSKGLLIRKAWLPTASCVEEMIDVKVWKRWRNRRRGMRGSGCWQSSYPKFGW